MRKYWILQTLCISGSDSTKWWWCVTLVSSQQCYSLWSAIQTSSLCTALHMDRNALSRFFGTKILQSSKLNNYSLFNGVCSFSAGIYTHVINFATSLCITLQHPSSRSESHLFPQSGQHKCVEAGECKYIGILFS